MGSRPDPLAADLAGRLDPAHLMRAAGHEPYDWQRDALLSTAPREAWACSRQAGKTQTAGALAVHRMLYHPGSTVLAVSAGQRQATELYRRALDLYRRLGRPVPSRSEAQTSMELVNGSRIVSLPANESTIRTYAVDLLLLDEAARIADEVYDAVSPMTAVSGGRIVALSTPYGDAGFFADAAMGRDPGWSVRIVPASEIPTISPAFLDGELRRMGPSTFGREYLARFDEASGSLFSMAQLRALANPSLRAPLAVTPGGSR